MGQVADGRSHSWIRQLEPRWWLVVLMAITWRLDRTVRLALADRLEIEGATRALMAEFPERLERVAAVAQSPGVAPHAVCAELETLTREEVTLLVVTQKKDVVGWVRRWLNEWRDLRLVIDGDDLRAAGVAESPQIGRALQATLEARQDGLIEAGEEMEYALGRIRQESG